jgi:penicillin amidase
MTPANDERFVVRGLTAPVEILVDHWGVPHVYASTTYDAFFAQGFNVARVRLWQIDLWRRRGLGLLSEVFGSVHVERDRAARLFLYRRDMHAEWIAYGSDTKRAVTAFVDGVNEYVELTERDPDLLPEEFRWMNYKPSFWSPEDVARIRSHGLHYNVENEVKRAIVLRDFGPRVEFLRRRPEPPRDVVVPEGLDLSLISEDVLGVYELAKSPVAFCGDPSVATSDGNPEGSNNWAVSPERTATGRPILANDPHRTQSVPSLRYVAHLCAPGMDVIGAGEPALPGISIGHNGRVAFGLTIFPIDQEDLYVYETNPDDSTEYRYQGRWEPMEVDKQLLAIKGGEPLEVELRFTRHGPVIYEDPDRRVAFALRAAWLEPGTAPYLGSMDYMQAKNWDEFLAAMNRWGAPGENQVYADVEGNIGWKPAGLIPIRPNWDGLLPVPGDGRYEWGGFLDMDQLPVELNPSRGWVATANEMNLPEDYPHGERKVSFEWYAPFRHQRIAEVLTEKSNLTLEDLVDLQTDYLSVPARRVVARTQGLRSSEAKVEGALEMLRGWDCVLAKTSAPAALFEVWYRLHLRPALLSRAIVADVPPEDRTAAVAAVTPFETEVGDARADLELLENPDSRLGPNPEHALEEVLLTSLEAAVEHLERLLGPLPEAWAWGNLHHALLVHPLSSFADGDARERLDVGPAPRGGSGDSVGNTAYRADDFRQTGGSSWRVAIDVGEWDNSLAMNSPGQSGNPNSAHYDDLFHEWAADGAFPLLYSRAKVEAACESRILIRPEKRPTEAVL